MKNLRVVSDILEKVGKAPKLLNNLGLYLVFELKMGLKRKDGLVEDGHNTIYPEGSIYAGKFSS